MPIDEPGHIMLSEVKRQKDKLLCNSTYMMYLE